MFSAGFKEKTAQDVPLPEKKSSEIKEMLLVIYPVSAKQIDGNNYLFLLNLAREYMMKKLTDKCEEYLTNCLSSPRQSSIGTCLYLLHIAQDYELERLQVACIEQTQNISLREMKNDSMYDKINFSNYQKIAEGRINQLELKTQYEERELVAVQRKVKRLQDKNKKVESEASDVLKELTTIASVLVQVIRDLRKDKYKGYFSTCTKSLEGKLRFISEAGGSLSHLRSPLNNLRSNLEAITQSANQVTNF